MNHGEHRAALPDKGKQRASDILAIEPSDFSHLLLGTSRGPASADKDADVRQTSSGLAAHVEPAVIEIVALVHRQQAGDGTPQP